MKLQLAYPLKPVQVSQRFGVNEGADYKRLLGLLGHPGEDLILPYVNGRNVSFGAPVRAAHKGNVIAIENDTAGGHTVVLITDRAYDYKGSQSYFKTVYAHCKAGSILVNEGDPVETGDVLGACGSSGVIPGAAFEDPRYAHVHFGLKPARWATDGPGLPYWANSEQDNGFGGAVDSAPFWSGTFAEDATALRQALEIAKQAEKIIATPSGPELIAAKLTLAQVLLNYLKSFFRK